MWGEIEFTFTFPNAEPISSAQYTPIGSNNGLAPIARGLFDTSQVHPSGSAPSTNNDALTPGDARPASDAPDVEEAKSISLSSTATASTTKRKSRPSETTLSAVDVPRPSSDQPKVAEQNGFRYADW